MTPSKFLLLEMKLKSAVTRPLIIWSKKGTLKGRKKNESSFQHQLFRRLAAAGHQC